MLAMGRKQWECAAMKVATETYVLQHLVQPDGVHVFQKKVRILIAGNLMAKLFPKTAVSYEHVLRADGSKHRLPDDEKEFGDCDVRVKYAAADRCFKIIWLLDTGRLFVAHTLLDDGAKMSVEMAWRSYDDGAPPTKAVKVYKRSECTPDDRMDVEKLCRTGLTMYAPPDDRVDVETTSGLTACTPPDAMAAETCSLAPIG
jgi:hypothetical protein